jgi:hypothetical protein
MKSLPFYSTPVVQLTRLTIIALAFVSCECVLTAQTQPAQVLLNESDTVQLNPLRIGLNNSAATYYDQGQFCKNWLCLNNPGFQGTISNQVFNLTSGTSTTFTGQDIYDTSPVGIWAGASFSGLPSPSSNSGFAAASGTIKTNSAANYSGNTGVVYTMSAQGSPAAKGDYVRVLQEVDLAPAGICAYNSGPAQLNCIQGWSSNLSNGAVISAENTDLPSGTYDLQAMTVNTTPTGGWASVTNYIDATYPSKPGNFLSMWSGTSYTFSVKCKTTSGTGTLTFSVQRSGGQNSTNTANCTNSWSTLSMIFTGTETASTALGTVQASISFSQGTVFEIVDAYLGQTSSSASNPTIYNDNYVNALKAFSGDTLRVWDSQVGDTFDDEIRPSFGRHWSFWNQVSVYFSGGETTASGYYDQLLLCQTIGVKVCTMVVPASWTVTDYQHLIEFLAGTSGTYPGKRNALDALYGRASGPFTAVIPEIVIELTDEPWNTIFPGENMPDQNDGYGQAAYGLRASQVFTAMKSDPTYVPSIKMALNCQTGSDYACINQILPNVSNADMVLLTTYVGETLDTFSTVNQEFDPQSGWGYSSANDTTNGWVARFAADLHTYLPSYPLTLAIYEGGYGTVSGNATTAQIANHNTSMINAAEIVQAYLENVRTLGITIQNIFQSVQGSENSNMIWGIFKDPLGGQLAGQGNYYMRQTGLGVEIANQCIGVGSTMYGANVTGQQLYSTSAMNGWPAWSNLPYLTAYAFKNGNNRCLLFTNTDPVNSATVSISGTNAPSTVTETLLLGSNIRANNESAAPGVTIRTTPGTAVAPTYTIPPYTVSAISWTLSSTGPTISNLQVSAVTEAGATVTWTTSTPASSQVMYGTSLAYGASTVLNSTLVTSHSVTLTGLTSGTLYDFAAESTDGSGNRAVSGNSSFTTLTRPSISNVQVSAITSAGATITWTTNTPTTSEVSYGTTLAYGFATPTNPTLVTSHSVNLTGLSGGASYDFDVTSADVAGDQVTSSNYFFTTDVPIGIANVAVSVLTTTSATITWTTSAPSSSQVVYSSGSSLSSPLNPALVTAHSVALSGLSAGTTYSYFVESVDAFGNQAESSPSAFTTLVSGSTGPGVVASGSGATSSSVTSIATGTGGRSFSCPAGRTAVAFVTMFATETITVSDSAHNPGWTSYGAQYGNAVSGFGQWFYNPRLLLSVTSVTASFSAQSGVGIVAHCVKGVVISQGDFAQATSSSSSGETVAGGAFTTSMAQEIVFLGLTDSNTGTKLSAGSGWSLGLNVDDGPATATEYQVFPGIQTGAAAKGTLGADASWSSITIGLKSAPVPPPAVVASGSGGTSSTVTSIATGTGGSAFSCAAGTTAVAFITMFAAEPVTVSDSASNSGWTSYGPQYGSSGTGFGQWFYNPRLAASISSVTASFAAQAWVGIIAHCVSGLSATPADFAQANSIGTWGDTITGGSFATSSAQEIVFLGLTDSNDGTQLAPGSGWSIGANIDNGPATATEYQVFPLLQSAQSATGTLGAPAVWSSVTIGLK